MFFIVFGRPELSDLAQDAPSLDPIGRQDHDPAAPGAQPPKHTAVHWYCLGVAILWPDDAENAA
jgi:hypothetical protein